MRTPHGRMNCIPWGVFSRLDRSTQGEAPVSHAVLPVGRGPPSICGPRDGVAVRVASSLYHGGVFA